MIKFEKGGLYAITPETFQTEWLCQAVEQALSGGATMLQYRNKSGAAGLRLIQAQAIAALCHQYQVPLIINDDIELCLAVNAAGVHLGKDDGDWTAARQALGPERLLGVSCYADLPRAQAAVAAGVDYIAFGSFFPSTTKPDAIPCPPATLEAARTLGRPVVAIGGITVENGASLVRAGADWLAVISDLFSARDIAQRAMDYQSLFTT